MAIITDIILVFVRKKWIILSGNQWQLPILKKIKVNVLEYSYTHSGDFLTSNHVGSMYVCGEFFKNLTSTSSAYL